MTRRTYTYAQLSEPAKEAVRQWLDETDDYWWDYIYEEFQRVAPAFGFDLQADTWRNSNNTMGARPAIYFTSYPWGAGFKARWHAKDVGNITAWLNENVCDEILVRAAAQFEAAIAKAKLAGLADVMEGMYGDTVGNEHCQSKEVALEYDGEVSEELQAEIGELCEAVGEAAYDLAYWLKERLEDEYDSRQTEEYIAETCEANDWRFTREGELVRAR